MLTSGGLTSLLTGSHGFRQHFNKTFTTTFHELLARLLARLRQLFSPKRLISFLRGLLGRKQRWPVKDFSNHDYKRISPLFHVEEETNPGYRPEFFYPVRIGEVFASRYQVVGKLGFGMTSTVWLARDLEGCRYVALKVYIRKSVLGWDELPELAAYRRLEKGPEDHPGRHAIRGLLDSFVIQGPDGEHDCLVHQPLWKSLKSWKDENQVSPDHLALILRQVLLAVDYLKECEVIHTDISENNIMFTLTDTALLERFENRELEFPTDRKEANGRIIYVSQSIRRPKDLSELGLPVLCDFGAAVWGGNAQLGAIIQPTIYRSPEVVLKAPWSYEVDIWNIGCLIWNLFQKTPLFTGIEKADTMQYGSGFHITEMMVLLREPPAEFLAQCSIAHEFFPNGEFMIPTSRIPIRTWDDLEGTLLSLEGEGKDRDLFMDFVDKMIRWTPRDRYTAKELLEDEWLTNRLLSHSKIVSVVE